MMNILRSILSSLAFPRSAGAVRLATLFALSAGGLLSAAPFTPGNLVVYRVGDGSGTLSSASTAVFLDEYSPAGALVQSIAMPTAVNGSQLRLTASGSATSEGQLTRSADGQYLIATGYDAAPGTASINGTTSATTRRVIARIDPNAAMDTTTGVTAFSGSNIRSAASVDGSAFWATGGNTGVVYAPLGMDSATVSTSVTNTRTAGIFGGQLYLSSGSGTNTFRGVNTVGTGLPTVAGATTVRLPGLTDATNNSNYGFFFADLDPGVAGVDTLYIADDGSGALTKFSLVSGSWVSNGIVSSDLDYRGLAGAVSGGQVTLYATRDNGAAADSIVTLVDASGYNGAFAGTPTVVATAALANTAMRGIAVAPQAAVRLLITEVESSQAQSGRNDFWELTNVGLGSVDLSNWKWDDDSANPNDAAAVTIPAGTSIAPGESVIFTGLAAATFRSWWGIAPTVQVITTGAAPGLGQSDEIHLFDVAGSEMAAFDYGPNGFTRSGGSPSAGGHAGSSAGGLETASAVWNSAFGTATPRYEAAAVGVLGAFASAENASDIGSPGFSGFSAGGGPSVTLSLSAIPTSFSESVANPASVGTVTRSAAAATDLIVNLSSSDTTEATVPATVTIPANQTTADFSITAVNDTFPDGNKVTTITASATLATPATFDVTVLDDGDTLDTSFLLTEIQSNQSAGSPATSEDYWELTNIGSVTKDLSGYSWHDSGRSGTSAAAYSLPQGTMIAPGESVIFSVMPPADFRAWWNLPPTVQVFQSVGAPGLGQGDGISFFDSGLNELFFFDYAAPSAGPPVRLGFTREDGSPSTGGHAAPSGGGTSDSQALIWVPGSGTGSPRYTAANGSNHGSFSAVAPATDLGSPGTQGMVVPSVNLSNNSVVEGNSGSAILPLTVTRSDVTTAFSVDYAVTGGTATSGTDYAVLASGTLQFTAGGAATQVINLTVTGDTAPEPDETVVVSLSNVVSTIGSTVVGTANGTATLLNDDVLPPSLTLQIGGSTIASGGGTTLRVGVTGSPAPALQWYQGLKGDTSNPVSGATSSTLLTPALTGTTPYWVRASNGGGVFDSDTITVDVVPGITSVDLSNYVRIGRHSLPEPLLTSLPAGTPVHNLLCQEASGVAYNPETDTLFVVADGGRSVTQVSKTGVLIDTMTLALGGSSQGTEFYDIEGITYIGGGQFVMSEERDRQLVKFTYAAGTTLTRAATQTVKIGTFVDNTGTEGLSYDPLTSGFIVLKEIDPLGLFQTTVDFGAGTASNGSPSTLNSINLFDPALLGLIDVADVFALSNLPSMAGQAQEADLIVLGQEDGRLVKVDRSGAISSTRQILADPGNPLSVGGQQHEGVTMDGAGNLYIVNENGGGGIDFPELWVYAPATAPNAAPTGITLNGEINSVIENTSTASPIRLGEIVVVDDGLGTNVLSLAGADAAFFEIDGLDLFLKAGTLLDFESKSSFNLTIEVNDSSVGSTTPDASLNYILTVSDQNPETPAPPVLLITEVAPWSSGESPVGADWIEVTNVSGAAIDITGWKVDDSSKSFASAVSLSGITTIAAGETVVFIETNDLPGKSSLFRSHWFGANPPSGLQIGNYTGSGIGLGTGGDAVWIYDALGQLITGVTFGASPAGPQFPSFDNTAGLNAVVISKLSHVGQNGAARAVGSINEIGSPGIAVPGRLIITEVAPWSSGNSPVGADWFEVTNVGARVVGLAGWKVDDSSESPAGAVALGGVAAIAPGESVIFLESETAATTAAAFLNNWFGVNPPAGLQVGAYSGSGIGLSTGGDAVNLYDPANVRHAKVTFGASPSSAPFGTFDNTALADNVAVTLQSSVGINGAVVAANSSGEVGSPGRVDVVVTPTVTGSEGGSVTGGGSLALGSNATFIATPESGYSFVGWIVNGSASSETSTSLTVPVTPGFTVEADFARLPFTLQLLHLADGEAGLLASQTAPHLAALVDAFDGDYQNTLILSGGDNFIPGPFLSAGTDPSLSAVPSIGLTNFARPDIAIHNLIGVEASAIGNHEWDLGSNVFMDAIRPDGAWVGAQFPHLSANLDYSADSAANARFTNVPLDGTTTAIPEASTLKSRLVPTAVITKGGEKIGLVGVTTQILRSISSPSGTTVKGFPAGTTGADDMDLLATHLQPYINELIAEGVNKIVLMSHLQQIANEQLLATKISGVDLILSAGSNTRLGDADDVATAFPGHAATFAGDYPLVTAGTDGKPTLILNTDNEYTYLGRLVIDFDENGEVILTDLPSRRPLNGAFAATPANVAAAWGVAENDLATTAFAAGTKGTAVRQVVDAVQAVINAKDGDIKGHTSVYLEGERNFVHSEETNFGNLSSDANAEFARALFDDGVPVVSLKNGGGIRAQIGAIDVATGEKLPPSANPAVGKPEGGISQLDIENSLRFNNRLMVFDTTPQGLKNILEHGVAAGILQGRFPQIGGVAFAWDPALPAGSRVTKISLIGEAGQLQSALYDGEFSPWAPSLIRLVTLNFLASNAISADGLGTGGDGYPMRANGTNFRFLLADGTLGAPVDPTLNFTTTPALPGNPLGEQQAFTDFLAIRHATPATAYAVDDTAAADDLRIQNLSLRSDAVPFDLTLILGGGGIGSVGNETLTPGERQGFRFTLADTRLVTLSATGSTALTAELIDENGNVVESFDGPGEILIGGILTAGEYLLRVSNAGPSDEVVSLTVDAGTVPATRPDVAVGTRINALRGVAVFTPPVSQQVSLTSRRLAPVRALATVANRGTLPDAMKVRATPGNRLFRTVYTRGGANVTGALVSGTFDTGVMTATDGPVVFNTAVTPDKRGLTRTLGKGKGKKKRTTLLRKTHLTQIRATSVANPAVSDAGQIRVSTR